MEDKLTHFTSSSKKRSILQTIRFVDGFAVLFVIVILATAFYLTFHEGNEWKFERYDVLFFSIFVIAASIALIYSL
jgi:hypothetical protein